MKKVVLIVFLVLIVLMIVSYFIPVRKLNEVVVANTYSNIIKATLQPRNWIKWNGDVKAAWQKDSSSCHFIEDSINHVSTIDIPGIKIQIVQDNFLLYHLTENKNNHESRFTFLLTMNTGEVKGTPGINTLITYGHVSRYLYDFFHYDDDVNFENKTIGSLRNYLENSENFYGFPIEIGQSPDSIFLTKTFVSSKKEIFKNLPRVFNELDSFARSKGVTNPVNKNIYFNPINKDSFSVNAGININKKVPDDYLISCKQFYSGQILIIGQYEGPFFKRLDLYKSMDQYLLDHQFVKGGASYERYLSPLPSSDSSMIKIELFTPLLNKKAN
jgi:hypothetical protein